LGVIDPAGTLIDRGISALDPEQFAISRWEIFIANEDDATASIVDLGPAIARKVKVSRNLRSGSESGERRSLCTCEERARYRDCAG
jgi:hypothetical protein